MSLSWDARIVGRQVVDLLGRLQRTVPCRIAGGAVLGGVHLRHRLSRDVDVFFDERALVREALHALPESAAAVGASFRLVRDGGGFVRGVLEFPNSGLEVDLVHDASRRLGQPDVVEGVVVESLVDLRANKLTCLLSRSEPRDLVDVRFLEYSGHLPESDLPNALEKDAGIDPGILAHLIATFPVEPLPTMLLPLTSSELSGYRDALAERLRRLAVTPGE